MNKVIKYIKENRLLLGIILMLLISISIFSYGMNKIYDRSKVLNQNLKAATEEVNILRTKNNNLLAEHASYVTTINDLNRYIDISKKEVKDLQKVLNSKIAYIGALEAEVNIQNTPIHDTVVVYKDSTYKFSFKFTEKWYEVMGNSVFDLSTVRTEINRLYVDVPLKVGLTEDWKIFVTTPNPYISFSSLDGAILDKNNYIKKEDPRRWGLGVWVGMNAGYDLVGRSAYVGPGIGLGFYVRVF